jgi:2-oxoisovalerate dehydrogenase E1 component
MILYSNPATSLLAQDSLLNRGSFVTTGLANDVGLSLFTLDRSGKPVLPIDPRQVYTFGLLIRETEQALLRLFSEGLLSGTTHTCIGQELCQMSVVRALDHPDDVVLSNHRNHGHFLTYSGEFEALIAEIMGRDGGLCGGIGGSQHLARRNFHSNGVQAGMTAIGVGRGMAIRMRESRAVVAAILGDGTLGEGLVYESLNLAAVWRVPVLFVVENNGIAQTTPTAGTTAGDIGLRGAAFGLPTWHLDDAAPDFLHRAEDVVTEVRRSRRPGFLVIDTRRLGPHSKGDDLRDPHEIAGIQLRDPLRRLGEQLPSSMREEIDRAAHSYIRSLCRSAEAQPPARRLPARTSIFAASTDHAPPLTLPPARTVRASLNAALDRLLQTCPEVILLGEDLHDPYGGAFKVTAGLGTRFPGRVLSMPISEAAIVGAGIGLALAGYRPVVEIMFADFVTLAMDQIFNHAVKFPGMFPDARVPLVIRTPAGGRRGYGPTHSQNPEGLLCGVPGLTVVFPTARHDAGTLLANAVLRWPYPTVFLEHKLLYSEPAGPGPFRIAEPSPADPGAELFPTLVAGGGQPDLTFVAYGGMLALAEAAAEELAAEELEIEIVAPALVAPLCRDTLIRLLGARPRILVLEESGSETGFGALLGSLLLENGYRGRFARLAPPPVPIPAARSLEEQVLPGADSIRQAVLRLLGLEGEPW